MHVKQRILKMLGEQTSPCEEPHSCSPMTNVVLDGDNKLTYPVIFL